MVITSDAYPDTVYEQWPEIPRENFPAHPAGGTPLPAVVHVHRSDPDGVMIVLPANHYIADAGRFQAVLRAGGKWLVTMGITLTRTATGYGYLARGGELAIPA